MGKSRAAISANCLWGSFCKACGQTRHLSFTNGPFQLAALDLSLARASRKPCTLLSMPLSLPLSCPLPLCLSNLICLRPSILCLWILSLHSWRSTGLLPPPWVLPCFGGSLSTPGYGLSCLIIRGGVIKTVVPNKEVATALPCLDELLLPALNSSLACWGVRFLCCGVVWLRTRWSPPRLAFWDFRWPKWINRWSAVWPCHGCLLRQSSSSCQLSCFPSATAAPFPCPRYGVVSVVPLCFVRQARFPSASSCSLCHPADLVAGRSCSLCLVRCGMFASFIAQCEALGPHHPHLQWTMGHFACCQCLAMDWPCAAHALDLSHPLRPCWLAPFLWTEAEPRGTSQQRSS